jgi:hypothetical protein
LSRIILPVVISLEEGPVAISQLYLWIWHGARDKGRQARANTADDDPVIAVVAPQNKARDQDFLRPPNKSPSAYIS